MRIVAGIWRGRSLTAPPGTTTRPTADRVRQALFDMLLHAPWGGRDVIEGRRVLDAFAGTGSLGLEALSRGATEVHFFETDRAARAALRTNIAALGAGAQCRVHETDARSPPRGTPCDLVLLDPPYDQGLVPVTLAALQRAGWLAPAALVVAELARGEPDPFPDPLASRAYGRARLVIGRLGAIAAG